MKRLIALSCMLFFCATVHANGKLGYGSATTVTTERIQEHFYLGFQLGFESFVKPKSSSSEFIEKRVVDGSPFAAVQAAKKLLALDAVGLFGFPTSHEALLVADLVQQEQILTIFAGASHSDLARKGPTVFTTGTNMKKGIDVMMSFVQRMFVDQRGLVIINPYAVFSVNQEKLVRQVLAECPKLKLDFAYLNKNLQLEQSDLKSLKSGAYDYLYVTPYPEELFRFFNQLFEAKIDLPLTAAASWATADPEIVIQRFLTQNKSPFYMSSEWVRGQAESQLFENRLKSKFKRVAIPEVAYGYDVGVIAGQLYNRVKKKGLPLTRQALLSAMRDNFCFDEVSVGRMCFDKKGGHAERPVFIVKFTKTGFVVVPNKNVPNAGKDTL